MHTPIPMIIDSREGSKDLVESPFLQNISQLGELTSGDRQLGDVMIYGPTPDDGKSRCIIELKSLADFLGSLPRNGGRIARQVVHVLGYDGERSLAEEYWIAVYGTWICGDEGFLLVPPNECPYPDRGYPLWPNFVPYRTARDRAPIPWSEVESTFTTLSRAGVQRAPHLPTKSDAARWIALLYRHLQKVPSDHKTLRSLPVRGDRSFLPPFLDPVTQRMVDMSMGILSKGIGRDKALKIAKHFSSVQEMIDADEAGWLVPSAIGGPTAKRIVAAIKERRKSWI